MRYGLMALVVVALAGCGVETVTSTAIEGAAQAENAKNLMNQSNAATGQLAQTKIANAIQAYYTETGAYPGSLSELVPNYLPALPMKADGSPFTYDAATGRVSN